MAAEPTQVQAQIQPELSLEDRIGQAAMQSLADNGDTSIVPEPAAEPQAAEPAAEPAPTDPHAKPDDAPEIRSLDDLRNFYGATEEDFGGLEVKVKVDGKEYTKPLSDVLKGYQMDAHNTQRAQELSAQKTKADSDYQAWQAYSSQQVQTLQNLAKYGQEMLQADFQGIDWNTLKMTDPNAFMLKRAELQDRQTQINAFLQQANQVSQNQQAQALQRQQAQAQETIEKRASIRPEWADQAVFNKDCGTIRDYLLGVGMNANDLPAVLSNSAYLRIADAASRYAALEKAGGAVQKKVQAAPKFVKPGASNPKPPESRGKLANQVLRSGQNGSGRGRHQDVDAQAAAFEVLLKGT